jgi:type II secretory pathway pseudopilin PulG
MTTSAISPRRADRRGLTLLEIILALGLVMAIAAISIPFTFREFAKQESSTTLDRIAMQVALARVESRQTGVPYELLIDPTGRRLNVRRLDPRDPGSIGTVGSEESAFDSGGLMATDSAMTYEEMPAEESWQVIELPVGMSIGPNVEEDGFSSMGYDPDGIEELLAEEDLDIAIDPWPETTRLVVFMPDGTLLGMQPLVIADSEERRTLTFDPWTGQLQAELIRRESFDDAVSLEEDPIIEPEDSMGDEEMVP